MACFEDYEVLNILDTSLNSTCYKVRDKSTNGVFIWKAINYGVALKESSDILEKISTRKLQQHPCLLNFYDYIVHEQTQTVYLVTEYCGYGSIANIIQKCNKRSEYISEVWIWNIIYKLANFCKMDSNKAEKLQIQDIFIDANGGIKVLNFTLSTEPAKCDDDVHCNIYNLEVILHQMVHLCLKYDLGCDFPNYYSKDLHNLHTFLTNPEPDVIPTLDSIIYHPAVILRQASNEMPPLFVKKCALNVKCEDVSENSPADFHLKLDKLRKMDAKLKMFEQELQERKYNLDKREKKIALMDRLAKEKITRAELYLKRSKEIAMKCPVKMSNDPNDTSFSADCGESPVVPTSCKLNAHEISKPAKFNRTASERRVRFKSHSPLKDIHNIKREFNCKKKIVNLPEMISSFQKLDVEEINKTSQKASHTVDMKPKKKFVLSSMFLSKKSRKPDSGTSSTDSVSAHTYEDLDKGWSVLETDQQDQAEINWPHKLSEAPLWNEDSKKQAFNLLRLMNQEEINEIKHTLL